MTNYKIKYGMVYSKDIINLCGPEYNAKEPGLIINDPELVRKAQRNIIELRSKFYSDLHLSIKHVGILNPILATAGYPQFKHPNLIPDQYKNQIGLWCEIQGGSRLYFAKKYDLFVPCIISDFCNFFEDGVELTTEEDILSLFKNKPEHINISDKGVRLSPPGKVSISQESKKKPTPIRPILNKAKKI